MRDNTVVGDWFCYCPYCRASLGWWRDKWRIVHEEVHYCPKTPYPDLATRENNFRVLGLDPRSSG